MEYVDGPTLGKRAAPQYVDEFVCRDFTVNAMAVDTAALLMRIDIQVIDPARVDQRGAAFEPVHRVALAALRSHRAAHHRAIQADHPADPIENSGHRPGSLYAIFTHLHCLAFNTGHVDLALQNQAGT